MIALEAMYVASAGHGSSSTRLCGGLAAVTFESWENLVLMESRMWGTLVVELLEGLTSRHER
jgi:hypothetical protein